MITHPPPAGQSPPAHDPMVCGLYADLCPGCAALSPAQPPKNPHEEARDRWGALLRDHWRLLCGGGPDTSQMPAPLAGEPLRQLVATGLSPQTRPLLDALLGDYFDDRVRRVMAAELPEAVAQLTRRNR